MKNLLVSTTGVVSLSTALALFLTPSVSAQEKWGDKGDSKYSYSSTEQSHGQDGSAEAKGEVGTTGASSDEFNAKIGGTFKAGFFADTNAIGVDMNLFNKKKDKNKDDKDDKVYRQGVFWNGKLKFSGSKILDSGTEVGIGSRFVLAGGDILKRNAPIEGPNVKVDRYYMYLQGIWGKVILGANSSASSSLSGAEVPAPGFDQDFSGNDLPPGGINIAGSGAVKATYLTPSIKYGDSAFQLGASWTPQPDEIDPKTKKKKLKPGILGLGAKYSVTSGSYTINLGAGYSNQGPEYLPNTGTEIDDDFKFSQARMGLRGSMTFHVSDFSSLTVGGKYTREQMNKRKATPNAATVKDILIGAAAYKIGPYKLSARYVYAKGNNKAVSETAAYEAAQTGKRFLEFVMPATNLEKTLDSRATLPGWYPNYDRPWEGQMGAVEGRVKEVNIYNVPVSVGSDSSKLYKTVMKDGKYVTRFVPGVKKIRTVQGAELASLVKKYQKKINDAAPTSLGKDRAGKVNADILAHAGFEAAMNAVTGTAADDAREYFKGKADEYLYITQHGSQDGRGLFAMGDPGVRKPWDGGLLKANEAGNTPASITDYNRHVQTIRNLYTSYREIAAKLGVSYEALMGLKKVDVAEERDRLNFLTKLKAAWDSNNAQDEPIHGAAGVSKVAADAAQYDLAIDQLILRTKLNIMRNYKFTHLSADAFKARVQEILSNNAAYGVRNSGGSTRMHVSMGGGMYKVSPGGVPQIDALNMGIYSPDPAGYGSNRNNGLVPHTAMSYQTSDFSTVDTAATRQNYAKEIAKYQGLRASSTKRSFASPYRVVPESSASESFGRVHDYFEYGFGRFGMADQWAMKDGTSDVLADGDLNSLSNYSPNSSLVSQDFKGVFHCSGGYAACSDAARSSWSGGKYMIHFLESGKGNYATGTTLTDDNSEDQKYGSGHVIYNFVKYPGASAKNPLTGNLVFGPSSFKRVADRDVHAPEYMWGKSSMLMNAKRIDVKDGLNQRGNRPSTTLARWGFIIAPTGSDGRNLESGLAAGTSIWRRAAAGGMDERVMDEQTEAFLQPTFAAARGGANNGYAVSLESPTFWLTPGAGEALASGRDRTIGLWPYSPYTTRGQLQYLDKDSDGNLDVLYTIPASNSRSYGPRPLSAPADSSWSVRAERQDVRLYTHETYTYRMQLIDKTQYVFRPSYDTIDTSGAYYGPSWPGGALGVPPSRSVVNNRFPAPDAGLMADEITGGVPVAPRIGIGESARLNGDLIWKRMSTSPDDQGGALAGQLMDVAWSRKWFTGEMRSSTAANNQVRTRPHARTYASAASVPGEKDPNVLKGYQKLMELSYSSATANPYRGGMVLGSDGGNADQTDSRGTMRSPTGELVKVSSPTATDDRNLRNAKDAVDPKDDIRLMVNVGDNEVIPAKKLASAYKRDANASLTGLELSLGYEVSSGFDVIAGWQYWDNTKGYLDDPLENAKNSKASYAYVGLRYDF